MSITVVSGGSSQVAVGSSNVTQIQRGRVKTDREKIVIYFDKPESWRGVLDVPSGFDQMDYDQQNDIIQKIVEEFQLRSVSVDYWDYSD